MPTRVHRPFLVFAVAAALGGLASVAGCGHRVGDTCNTNVDCSPLGDRFCDIASPGGYCTIEGCDVRLDDNNNLVDSCQKVASESICERFFTPLTDKAHLCQPTVSPTGCFSDEICLCDQADTQNPGQCVGGVAHCAKQSSERRWCMLKCNQNSDCRQPGYCCIQPGSNGTAPVPSTLVSTDAGTVPTGNFTQKFCVFSQTACVPDTK